MQAIRDGLGGYVATVGSLVVGYGATADEATADGLEALAHPMVRSMALAGSMVVQLARDVLTNDLL